MSAVKLPPPVVVRNAQDARVTSTTLLGAPAPKLERPSGHSPIQARAIHSPLFRDEALRAYRLGQSISTPLRVVPLTTGMLLATVAVALLAALLVAGFGHVDLTARGRGTIRAADGLQPLRFEIEGVVRQVLVHNGSVVQSGQVLVRLDSTRLRAAQIEAEQQLIAVRERVRRDDEQARARHDRDVFLLEERARLMRARIASQRTSVGASGREWTRYQDLAREGVVAEKTTRESEALLNQQRRDLWSLEDELARVGQQVAELEQGYRGGVVRGAHEIQAAEARVESARRMIGQTELRAARAGKLESVAVSEGDVVAPTLIAAQLVSLETFRNVVAFVPERDRAFVRAGLPVRIEFDQLPVGEFGSARGKVVRVASEVASQAELERVLGAAAPEGVHFATYIAMQLDERSSGLLKRVGSGTLLSVRMPVRKRRILSLLFEPVRKWLD